MSGEDKSAIFIHSLFRSGSTYIFHVFRRARMRDEPLYTAYQEPIHDVTGHGARSRAVLLAMVGKGEAPRSMRHPQIGAPYFQELYDSWPAWHDKFHEDIVYKDFFGQCCIEKSAAFLRCLAQAAAHRPVIQECRTSLRMARLKPLVGGTHVLLWRNPWDQWWSFKATDYFDTALQVAINSPAHPLSVAALRKAVDHQPLEQGSISEQFQYYGRRRPSAEASYLVFYTLWLLSLDQGLATADFDINIDRLSTDEVYREATIAKFAAIGANGLSFSDACVPQGSYGATDRAFFLPIEERALALLASAGMKPERLDELVAIRNAAQPAISEAARDQPALAELESLRAVLRRIETREAGNLADAVLECATQRERNQQKDEEIRRLQTSIDEQIGNAEAAVAERDLAAGQLSGLRRDLIKSEGELNQVIAQHGIDTARLRAVVEEQNALALKVAAERDRAIEESNLSREMLAQHEADLIGIAKQSEAEIAQLHASLEEQSALALKAAVERDLATEGLHLARELLAQREADLTRMVEHLEADAEHLHAVIEEQSALAMTASLERDHAFEELGKTRDVTAERETELTHLSSELARLHKTVADQSVWGQAAMEHHRLLAVELDAMRGSTSWRITSPMRGMVNFVRRGAGFVLRVPRAAARRTASIVRARAPALYHRIAVNRKFRRVFYAVGANRPDQFSLIESAPALPAAGPPAAAAAPLVPMDVADAATLLVLRDRMRPWTGGARLDGN